MTRTLAVRLGALLSLIGVLAVSAVADGPQQVLELGKTRIVVEPYPKGVSIYHDGVLISRGSNMVVTQPPWTPHYYLGPSAAAVAQAERIAHADGTLELKLAHRAATGEFEATESIILRVHDRAGLAEVSRTLRGRNLKPSGDCLIQWRIAGLNPTLLVGRPYKARRPDGWEVAGIIPVIAPDGEAAYLANGEQFESLLFDTRIGELGIQTDIGRKLSCYDYRKNRWANPTEPMFWFGDNGTRFGQAGTVYYGVTFWLPAVSKRDEVAAGDEVVSAPVQINPNAQTWTLDDPPTIVPRPKHATFTGRDLVSHASDLPIAYRAIDVPADKPRGYYRLNVSDAGIVAETRADDADAKRYAAATLAQLRTRRADGAWCVAQCEIEDWPSLGYRGVHFFTGGQGSEIHEKLIDRVLGPLKMNQLVLEAEYTEWESHPELHHPSYGMPKAEVKRILERCRANGVEVAPLVMSLGHAQYLFETGHHIELAEDPDAKWAYCVTNPKTYELIYDIYAEALELFQPKWFHIGHDEYHDRGRVPYRESSKPYTVEQLFMIDTLRHHEWFAVRGVRLMMWGDMLLAKGEAPDACNAKSLESAEALRAELPNDVVICDWHYVAADPDKYTSLQVFKDAGHAAIASTWNRPENITNFAKAAYDAGSLGLLQTTWAGYSLDPTSFAQHIPQYAAYVLAAEAAWNADNPPNPAAYPAGEHFLRFMDMRSLRSANRAGWTADLSAAANYSLQARDDDGWFGLGPAHDVSAAPHGGQRLSGVQFAIAGVDGAARGVATRGKLARDLPQQATVKLASADGAAVTAETLVFLHTANFAGAADEHYGTYEIRYADGGIESIELRYGENLLAVDDLNAVGAAPIVWRGATPAGTPVALRVLVWENPSPTRAIEAVTLKSANGTGSVVWLGLTGLNGSAATP